MLSAAQSILTAGEHEAVAKVSLLTEQVHNIIIILRFFCKQYIFELTSKCCPRISAFLSIILRFLKFYILSRLLLLVQVTVAQRAGLELCVQLIVAGYSKHTLLYLIRAVELLDVVRYNIIHFNITSKCALYMFYVQWSLVQHI